MTAADWDEIGDRHYRKREIYSNISWRDENGVCLNLNDQIIVGASFGGPIAMVADERKHSSLINSNNLDNILYMRIYTSSGKLISSFKWIHRGLIKLGWSSEEHLIVVLEDANVVIYNIFGKRLKFFSMGQECEDAHIADAYIWSTGLVVRTAGDFFQFWAIMNIMDPDDEPFALCNPNIERPPVFMTCINPDITLREQKQQHNNTQQQPQKDNDIEVLISTGDGGIYCISSSRITKLLQHRGGAIMKMSVSSNGRMIAIFDENMNLIVSTRNFQQQASNFKVKAKKQPLSMKWCGSDAVVLLFNNDQIIVAASNEFIPYPYTSTSANNRIILIEEVDSIRILTSTTCEILSIVPFSTQDIFSYGSQEPASLLYDSYEDFEAGDARADSHRRAISPDNMEDAVMDCLDAAKHELEIIEYQIKLLRACKYGKLFIQNQELFDCDQFVETCRFLRILNNIRHESIGIPLTYTQFEILTPEVVVQRLIHRKKHLLAIRISKYLSLSYCVNDALEHWAICKIESTSSNINDQTLVNILRNKILQISSDFSYAKIAKYAKKRSVDLAKLLLNYEPRSKIQINSLIHFEQYQLALKKSLISLDTNLINQTLIELISKYSDKSLWMKLYQIIYNNNTSTHSNASNKSYYSPFKSIMNNVLIRTFINLLINIDDPHKYSALLSSFLLSSSKDDDWLMYQPLNYHINGRNNLKKSITILKTGNIGLGDMNDPSDDTKECLMTLEKSTKSFEKLKNKFNVQMCSDLKRLIIFQKQFDKKQLISSGGGGIGDNNITISTLGLSVNDTISVMLDIGDIKFAEKIKKEMFLTEKRWWYLLINSYINNKQYDKLCVYIDKNTSNRKPPPIGYLSIIELFLEANQKEYAKKYILKLNDIDEKLEWLCQLKFWMDAVDVATADKDFDALHTIKANCADDKVKKRIDDILDTLS